MTARIKDVVTRVLGVIGIVVLMSAYAWAIAEAVTGGK